MQPTMSQALKKNFLGNSPGWYEKSIILFLLINPLALWAFGPFVTGWMLIAEFIFHFSDGTQMLPSPTRWTAGY